MKVTPASADTSDTTTLSVEKTAGHGRTAPSGDVVVDLTSVLDLSLRALADSGQPVTASRFAARAWSLLRTTRPEQAERLNRTMHYLARREAESEQPIAR